MISMACAAGAKPPASHSETIPFAFMCSRPAFRSRFAKRVFWGRDRKERKPQRIGESKMAPQALEKAQFGIANGAREAGARRRLPIASRQDATGAFRPAI